jgi:hypothetical protein
MKSADRFYVAVCWVHVAGCYEHGNWNFFSIKKLACFFNSRMSVTKRKVQVRQSDKTVYVRITVTFVLFHCHIFQPNWIVTFVVIVSSSVDNSGPKHVTVVLKRYCVVIIIIIIIIIVLDWVICITNYETQRNIFCQDWMTVRFSRQTLLHGGSYVINLHEFNF